MKDNGNILKFARLVFVCAAAVVAGCSGEKKAQSVEQTNAPAAKLPVFELNARDWTLQSSTNRVKIAKMQTNDVIVAVNGHPLTKADFDMMVTLKQMVLKRNKSLTPREVSKYSDDFALDYPRNFTRQRLVADAAIAKGIVTTNEIENFIEKTLAASAKRQRTTPERLLKRYGRAARYMMYDQSMEYITARALASTNFFARAIVGDEFADAVHKSVLEENAKTSATNAQRVAKLKNVKKIVDMGEMTFEQARERFSELKDEDREDGLMGEYERGNDEIKAVSAEAFGLKEGATTGIVEDDDFAYFCKVVSVSPEKKGGPGIGLVEPEKRTLSRIGIRKEPLLIVEKREELLKDLQKQMDVQAYGAFVDSLVTNAAYRVVYPNGIDFF